jgi:hypothetical protein
MHHEHTTYQDFFLLLSLTWLLVEFGLRELRVAFLFLYTHPQHFIIVYPMTIFFNVLMEQEGKIRISPLPL